MRKTYKKIISLCAVLILVISIIPVFASAADPFTAIAVGGIGGASGAGLFGSMAGASGVSIGFSNVSTDQADALWNGLNPDSVYFSGEKGQVTEPDPITGTPTLYDYITVDISDWLQAQNDYIDEFVNHYSVTDNSSGTISTPKSYMGVALSYRSNDNYYYYPTGIIYNYTSAEQRLDFLNLSLVLRSGNTRYLVDNVQKGSVNNTPSNFNGYQLILYSYSTGVALGFLTPNGYVITIQNNWYQYANSSASYTSTWSSSTVNTGVFDGYTAAKVMIPASSWSPSDPVNWDPEELLKELTNKWVNGTQADIVIEDDQPAPPPVPVPTTPLGDIPVDEWYDLFGLPVLEGQEQIHTDLEDFSEQVQEGVEDIVGELEEVGEAVDSIDTNLGVGNGLLGDIKSIGQTISNTLSQILSGVGEIVEDVVLSTETFVAGLLNSIMGGLGGMFSTMREAFTIWHYVVEWVGSISTVFSWFWNVAGSASYYIQLPIYAALAGSVVLAFYKRFGR